MTDEMPAPGVDISVNGRPRRMPAGATVADLVDALGLPRAGAVAVAVDDQVVPRSVWRATPLETGQSVEVLTAVQGG
jgi:sulfur carrier protein